MVERNHGNPAPSPMPPQWAIGVIPLSEIVGDTSEETALLLDLGEMAKNYLSSFSWCQAVREIYFGEGIGKICGLFLCRITPSKPDVDEWLWVIVGDVPPAYLVTDRCKSPAEAFDGYVEEMSRWIELAAKGKTSNKVIPVNVPPTPVSAEDLRRRLDTLGQILRPWLPGPPIKHS